MKNRLSINQPTTRTCPPPRRGAVALGLLLALLTLCNMQARAQCGISASAASPGYFCQHGSINLTASGALGNYSWAPAAGLSTDTGATVTASPSQSTPYTVYDTSVPGCFTIVTATMGANFSVAPPTPSMCEQNHAFIQVNYNQNSGINLPFTWTTTHPNGMNFVQHVSQTIKGNTYITPTGGTSFPYTIPYTVTATDINGCTTTRNTTIYVSSQAQTLTSVSPDVTICDGESVNLTATGNYSTFTWTAATPPLLNLSDITILASGVPFTASPSVTTTYSVRGRNSAVLCQSAWSTVTVTVDPQPGQPVISETCLTNGMELTATAANASTYTWAPATGLNTTTGATVIASPTTTTTYTVTAWNAQGTCSTQTTHTVQGNAWTCCHTYMVNTGGYGAGTGGVLTANTANFHEIDAANFGGVVVFDGTYHVQSPLRLINGQFEFRPGTTLFFEPMGGTNASVCNKYPLQQGQNFLSADKADIIMRACTLTSVCENLWGGVFLEGGCRIYMQGVAQTTPQGTVWQRAVISNAVVGLGMEMGCNNHNLNEYYIDRAHFQNNVVGLWDSYKNAVAGEHVTNSEFSAALPLPFTLIVPSSPTPQVVYGQAGINLENAFTTAPFIQHSYSLAQFDNNDFTGFARHGMMGRASDITISNSRFSGIGMSAIMVGSDTDFPVNIVGNTIDVPNTVHPGLGAGIPAVGVEVVGPSATRIVENNTITGVGTIPSAPNIIPGGQVPNIGVLARVPFSELLVEGNTISNLVWGFELRSTGTYNNIEVTNNLFHDDLVGILYQATSAANTPAFETWCNTFEKSAAQQQLGNRFWGILADGPGVWMNDLGAPGSACGNAFYLDSNTDQGVTNDDVNFRYFGYDSSSPEHLTFLYPTILNGIFGTPGGNYFAVPYSTPTHCDGLNNGTQRVMGTSAAAIAEMMDSLRYQVGSDADLRYYIGKINSYHLSDPALIGALEGYTALIAADNLLAHNALRLSLMAYHRQQGNEMQAQQHRQALQVLNPADTDLQSYCQYFDVTSRLGTMGRIFYTPDSADISLLEVVAASGTGTSPVACRLLQFYNPAAYCYFGEPGSGNIKERATAKTTAHLGQSYPNPAQSEARVEYQLPEKASSANIVLIDVVTGREVGNHRLPANETAGSLTLPLHQLANGCYAYTLVVDGAPVATKKMIVIK